MSTVVEYQSGRGIGSILQEVLLAGPAEVMQYLLGLPIGTRCEDQSESKKGSPELRR
jgi:hypothetical protein